MEEQIINPDKQTVESCLKNRTYYIDFYQREYVWSKETVEVLLRDVFYAFELSYEQHKDKDFSQETLSLYNWYYLNIVITNNVGGKSYIVDGQQRLTTLTLVAAKLYHIVKNDILKGTLKECIFGCDKWKGNVYRLDHDKRKRVMDCILNDKERPAELENRTEENLLNRYEDISRFIDAKNMDDVKLELFVSYFLERLVLVELGITKDDTPMVFEVINDRGEALKPFEILKGKLVGALDKEETDLYSEKWDKALAQLGGLEDAFFVDYIRSQFISRKNSKLESAVKNAYHRYIFENNEIANTLGFRPTDKHRLVSIKEFIGVKMGYYSRLYQRLHRCEDEFLQYNSLLMFNNQYALIMAACDVDDPEETDKIHMLAKEYDRLYTILRLNLVYDSNRIQEIAYYLYEKVHGVKKEDYRRIFDEVILQTLREARNNTNIVSVLDYNTFLKVDYSNLEKRFLRYFLARVEKYLCDGMQQAMKNDVAYIVSKTGWKTGYHIEHILSHNEENKQFFESDEEFESMRNKLGGLLLLKDADNISSGNEKYTDKLKTYSAGLCWGHSLCDDFYHVNKSLEDLNNQLEALCKRKLHPYATFDKTALEERSSLLFELVRIIWEV